MSHYYKTDNNLSSERKKIKYDINGEFFTMTTDNGVFSKGSLDYATRLLLENVEIKENQKVLDMGCGYGVVGKYVKTIMPSTSVVMVDVNERALELAVLNTEGLGVSVFSSDAYESVEGKFDLIITNPPIRAGKQVVHKILKESVEYLNDSGELWFIMNKKHGLSSAMRLLEDFFDDAETIKKQKGFSVVRCIKNTLPKQKIVEVKG